MSRTFCSCMVPTDGTVEVDGKIVRFEFTRIFGPLLVDDNAQPLEEQPIFEDHPFWAPFLAWLAEYGTVQAVSYHHLNQGELP
jgi:hypothetical protein